MPGSLLLIAVVWIVLLTPLVLFNRRPVRHTSEALTETRLVHSGGTELRGKRKLRPSPALYTADDRDEELELVDAEPEYVLLDDEGNGAEPTAPGKSVAVSDETKGRAGIAKVEAEDSGVIDAEVVDGELVDDAVEDETGVEESAVDSTATGTATDAELNATTASENDGNKEAAGAVTGHAAQEGADGGDAQSDEAAETGLARKVDAGSYKSQDEIDTGEFEPVAEEDIISALQRKKPAKAAAKKGAKQATKTDTVAESQNTAKPADEKPADAPVEVPVGVLRGVDFDDSRGREDHVRELATAGTARPVEKLYDSMELSEDDMNYIASRRGRGVFDPVASAEANRRRQQRRKHVLMGLVAILVLTLGLALWQGAALWLAPVVMTILTVFYLVALRKNAIEEAKLRRRRLARMRRARLGVHNTEDHELGVIPERLMRPGAVIIEPDEADAELHNLAIVDSRDFFRAPDEEQIPYDNHHIRAV